MRYSKIFNFVLISNMCLPLAKKFKILFSRKPGFWYRCLPTKKICKAKRLFWGEKFGNFFMQEICKF